MSTMTATPRPTATATRMNRVMELFEEYCGREGIHRRNWRIKTDKKLNRVAACRKDYPHFTIKFRNKTYIPAASQFTFFVSEKHMAVLTDEQLRDIVIHEVAHAVTDPRQSAHGAMWRANARRMGGTGNTYHYSTDEQNEALKKYKGTCPQGHTFFRNRKNHETTYYCPTCSPTHNGRKVYGAGSAITWKTLR